MMLACAKVPVGVVQAEQRVQQTTSHPVSAGGLQLVCAPKTTILKDSHGVRLPQIAFGTSARRHSTWDLTHARLNAATDGFALTQQTVAFQRKDQVAKEGLAT